MSNDLQAARGVIYARYSSSGQREESIEGQLRECHEYAEKHNIAIVGEYCDHALSGTSDKRPDFRRRHRAYPDSARCRKRRDSRCPNRRRSHTEKSAQIPEQARPLPMQSNL